MKKIIGIIILYIALKSKVSYCQEITCEELTKYVEKEGYSFEKVNSFQLIESSWLNEVQAYLVNLDDERIIFVIASIKQDKFGFSNKKYIFCNVPKKNWDFFSKPYLTFNTNESYGDRFHKYIRDYECNCN
jgi:hypothetical protein